MAKGSDSCDVLIMGGHPSAYLAGALLRDKTSLSVIHVALHDEVHLDRLVLINPELFAIHKILTPLQRKLSMSGTYGLKFLGDTADTSSEYRSRSTTAHVGQYAELRAAMMEIAEAHGVEMAHPVEVKFQNPDCEGVRVELPRGVVCAKVLMLAGRISKEQEKMLGLPVSWGEGVMHRYSFVAVQLEHQNDAGARPVIPMSLDLNGSMAWGWLLVGEKSMQICISQAIESIQRFPPGDLLRHWVGVLQRHGVLKESVDLAGTMIESVDLPLAGALAHEGVADRAVLIGPAGGFYSACAEDIYPNCWSAVFAAAVLKKALKATHLQDALGDYRSDWRTTLGEYLRGPQQNLRFLLPLVYRNQMMTNRLSESILQGQSVVR